MQKPGDKSTETNVVRQRRYPKMSEQVPLTVNPEEPPVVISSAEIYDRECPNDPWARLARSSPRHINDIAVSHRSTGSHEDVPAEASKLHISVRPHTMGFDSEKRFISGEHRYDLVR